MVAVINKLINQYGTDIQILKRTESTDDTYGYTEYTYSSTISTKAILTNTRGLLETWLSIGTDQEVDYVASVRGDTNVSIRDIVSFSNEEYEVLEVIPRKTGQVTDYYELLLRRRT